MTPDVSPIFYEALAAFILVTVAYWAVAAARRLAHRRSRP